MQAEPLFTTTLVDLKWIGAYVLVAVLLILPRYPYALKQWLLAALNLGAVFFFFFGFKAESYIQYGVMLAVLVLHWFILRAFNATGNDGNRLYWLAFLFPIVLLIAFKAQSTLALLGASYLSFRMAQTAFELRGRPQIQVGLGEYLAFLVFPPTFSAGPISPFLYYRETATGASVSLHNIGWGLLRIAIGYIKFRFLATFFQQLTFGSHWNAGFQHDLLDFLLSGASYYLYLFMNFSGYTDIAVGLGALLGIRVRENFANPFLARNVKDFWRRWHLSLTEFVRDAVFTPLSMVFMRRLGPNFATLSVLIATFATFTVLAMWHGVEAGFFIFYGAHALAFAFNQITEDMLRRRGRGVLRRYMDNPWTLWTGRVLTFLFLSATCSFLELRSWAEITKVVALMS